MTLAIGLALAILVLTLGLLAHGRLRTDVIALLATGLGIVLVLLISLSRVVLGVHYPSDVLVGQLIAGATASVLGIF